MAASSERSIVPVHIVTGALGAGKTTFLRRYVAGVEKDTTRVVVNEFADGGVDQFILGADGSVPETLFGCICCRPGEDIVEALRRSADAGSGKVPDRIIIETSGLAAPVFLIDELTSDIRFHRHFALGWVLAVADASLEPERWLEDGLALDQFEAADFAYLSNIDRVYAPARADAASRATAAIRQVNPRTRVFQDDKAWCKSALKLEDAARTRRAGRGVRNRSGGPAHRDGRDQLASASFRIARRITQAGCRELAMAISLLGGIRRLKILVPTLDPHFCLLISSTEARDASVERVECASVEESHVYIVCRHEQLKNVEDFIRFHFA